MAESKLARLRQYYREGGAELVLQVACHNGYLPERMCHYSVSDLFRLRALDDRLLRRMRGDYLFSDATRADAEALSMLAWGDTRAERVDYLAGLTDGQRIIKVTSGDALVGFLQLFRGEYDLSRDDYRDSKLHLVLEPGDLFLGYGFIDPAHRLKGIFPFLIRHAIDTSPPGSRFFTDIDRLNSGSRKAHLRLGFELAGSVRAWWMPGITTRWSLLAPDGGPPRRLGNGTPRIALATLLTA